MDLIPFEYDIIPDWQSAVDNMSLSPSPLSGPEYFATMRISWGNTYIYRQGDTIIPLAKSLTTHSKIMSSDLYTGARFNSILGADKIDPLAVNSLNEICRGCYIKLHIPEETYISNEDMLLDAGYVTEDIYNYYKISLPESYEEWFESPKICRPNIIRARVSGLSTAIGGIELLEYFYDLYMKSFARWKSKHRTKHHHEIERYRRMFELPGSKTKIMVAYLEGRPVAAAIFCYYRNTAGAFAAGMDYEYQKLRPADFVQSEIIRFLIAAGVKEYNMGGQLGSKSLDIFKKKLGAKVYRSYLVGRHRFPQLKKIFGGFQPQQKSHS